MTLSELAAILEAEIYAGRESLTVEISSGYASDMLSDVMGHASRGQVWFTIQTHPNIAAVALLLNLAAVVITGGHQPDPAVVAKAQSESLVLLGTPFSTFEAIRRLSQAGL